MRLRSMTRPARGSELATTRKGLRDRYTVSVLQVVANRQAAGKTRDAHAQRADHLLQVQRRRLPLHARVRRDDHLTHTAVRQPAEQPLHVQDRKSTRLNSSHVRISYA